MVTEVRQRVTRTLLGRRGAIADPIWVNRRLLLTGAEHLSTKQWQRLWRTFEVCDPTKEARPPGRSRNASGCFSLESEPPWIRRRLSDFYLAAIDAPSCPK